MRIKCPYSDIMLELPGDRTDMKFTCPACHKMHRVTVRISTPGEDPSPEPRHTRTVNRTQPQIPKKYATGAYAPVVDIPIDANFVLLDGSAEHQKGVDLGLAATPDAASFLDPGLHSRKTEVVSDRRPKTDKPPAPEKSGPEPEANPEPEQSPEPEPPVAVPEPEPSPTAEEPSRAAPEPEPSLDPAPKPEPSPGPEESSNFIPETTDAILETAPGENGGLFEPAAEPLRNESPVVEDEGAGQTPPAVPAGSFRDEADRPAEIGKDDVADQGIALAPPPFADEPPASPGPKIELAPQSEAGHGSRNIFETPSENEAQPEDPMPGLMNIGIAPEPEAKPDFFFGAPELAGAPRLLDPLLEPEPEKPGADAIEPTPPPLPDHANAGISEIDDAGAGAPVPHAGEAERRGTERLESAKREDAAPARPDVPPPVPERPDATPADPGSEAAPSASDPAGHKPHESPHPRTSDRLAAVSGRGTTRTAVETAPPRTGGRKTGILVGGVALAAVLACGGYFGLQHRRHARTLEEARQSLAQADKAWNSGDVHAAAAGANAARAAMDRAAEIGTIGNVWSGIGGDPASRRDAEIDGRIRRYLDRERTLASFRNSLDPANAGSMATLFGETRATIKDQSLVRAMEKAVIDESIAFLGDNAETMSPEEARAIARKDFQALEPYLSEAGRTSYFNEISAFNDIQRRRLADEAREEISAIAAAAAGGEPMALLRYRALVDRLRLADIPELSGPVDDLGESEDRDSLLQLATLSEIVDRAVSSARSALSRNPGDETEIDGLVDDARKEDYPNPAMAEAAAQLVDETRSQSDDLVNIKNELIGRLQTEMRRNRDNSGIRLALSMLRIATDDPGVEIDPQDFRFTANGASMGFVINGLPASMEMDDGDYERQVRATIGGYTFRAGWALLFHKPVAWMARMARDMRTAGIDPMLHRDWQIVEGPGGLMALSIPAGLASGLALADLAEPSRRVFWENRLLPVTELPQPTDARRVVEDFRKSAESLHDVVMASESISQTLRQALKPILMGAYQAPDPRDYFDSAFCRRLIEADYLETYITPMPRDILAALDAYRVALSRLEAGYDEFSVELEDGAILNAVVNLDADFSGSGRGSDQDPETGESVPRYSWRLEKPGETVFFSPMPSRFIYAFMLAEYYDGTVQSRPEGVPRLTEVWHITQGRIASYKSGDNRAIGDAELWNAAISEDSNGRFDPSIGPPGWNFPIHVLQRDDQGDPVLLATLSGVVMSPNFSGYDDDGKRRAAEDAWLDSTARTLSAPGELGLIFHQFFRYCSDSPLPELPNLIGSHYGLSDTHQTVYESLERRWVGRLIGDCDDLAEFFQELTRRQGKLSHVMQLPGHAAAGYVDKTSDRSYRFVVLQTGPVLQFNAPTLNEAVEIAYRSFDRGEGLSHMTTDAVPLLLRFADEETRTPFVLSARIYGDEEYAKTMIQVQSYWHEHVYSAAIKVMENLVEEDQEIGNIKELGSLYERVGFYDRSAELRRRELDMVRDNPQAMISTLLELVQLHIQEKNKEKALDALGQMEGLMQDMIRKDDAEAFFRAMSFRSFWAMYLARLGQPARAWNLIRYDATLTKRQLGRVADPVLRTLIFMYERMSMDSAARGGDVSDDFRKAMDEVRAELEEAFGKGYFKSDDSYNAILGRYFLMGRYAVSDFGRTGGMERLLQDGPYPTEPKDQSRRTRGVQDDDWNWFRITPQLYYALAMEMLDQDEFPELYAPEAAKPILEGVGRAVAKGTGLGSDVAGGDDVIKSELTLAFLNRDLSAFRACMAKVKEKDYSSLYDDAAMTFGLQCGLVPLAEFQDWINAFHEFFPGSQHYFKVVYRAIDKENYDHALMMAEATPRFFPGRTLLSRERDFVRSIIPNLKERKNSQPSPASETPAAVPLGENETPAA